MEASLSHSNPQGAALKNLGEGSVAQANLVPSKQGLSVAHWLWARALLVMGNTTETRMTRTLKECPG